MYVDVRSSFCVAVNKNTCRDVPVLVNVFRWLLLIQSTRLVNGVQRSAGAKTLRVGWRNLLLGAKPPSRLIYCFLQRRSKPPMTSRERLDLGPDIWMLLLLLLRVRSFRSYPTFSDTVPTNDVSARAPQFELLLMASTAMFFVVRRLRAWLYGISGAHRHYASTTALSHVWNR